MITTPQELGRLIRRKRQYETTYSQRQLALQAGVSMSGVGMIERAQIDNPSWFTVERILQTLHVGSNSRPDLVIATVPAALRIYANTAGLAEEDVLALAALRWRGRQPLTEDGWAALHMMMRVIVEQL